MCMFMCMCVHAGAGASGQARAAARICGLGGAAGDRFDVRLQLGDAQVPLWVRLGECRLSPCWLAVRNLPYQRNTEFPRLAALQSQGKSPGGAVPRAPQPGTWARLGPDRSLKV